MKRRISDCRERLRRNRAARRIAGRALPNTDDLPAEKCELMALAPDETDVREGET